MRTANSSPPMRKTRSDAAHAGGQGGRGVDEHPVATDVALGLVDEPEVVEVDDRERQARAGCAAAPTHWRSSSSWKARWLPRPVSESRRDSARARA